MSGIIPATSINEDENGGIFGEPRVNVMTLNFALDGLASK
jgi:K+-transporting ATPase c subunit